MVLHNILRSQYQGQHGGQQPGDDDNNCYCSNQSFSGLITSPFQDCQIFQKQLISCACSKYHNHFPTEVTHPTNRQTQCPTEVTHPTEKPNAQHMSSTQQRDKPNAKHRSTNQQIDKSNAKHNLLHGINIACILKATP